MCVSCASGLLAKLYPIFFLVSTQQKFVVWGWYWKWRWAQNDDIWRRKKNLTMSHMPILLISTISANFAILLAALLAGQGNWCRNFRSSWVTRQQQFWLNSSDWFLTSQWNYSWPGRFRDGFWQEMNIHFMHALVFSHTSLNFSYKSFEGCK